MGSLASYLIGELFLRAQVGMKMYFCSLQAIIGAEIDVLSVRKGDTVNDQHLSGLDPGTTNGSKE